jgi:hypothetical protein
MQSSFSDRNKLSATFFAYPRSKLAVYYGEKEHQSTPRQGTQRPKSPLALQGARYSAVANKPPFLKGIQFGVMPLCSCITRRIVQFEEGHQSQ